MPKIMAPVHTIIAIQTDEETAELVTIYIDSNINDLV